MEEGIKEAINVYHSKGIYVHNLNTDNEFECINDDILPVQLHVVAAEEHVGDVERSIRTVKEGTVCDIQRLPYTHYPRAMDRGYVIKRAKDLNQLPSNYGISTELSPATLLTGKPSPDFLQVTKLNFGDYAVALYPSGNEAGGLVCMTLTTRRGINRNKCVELPVGDEVLERIKSLAIQEEHPSISTNFVYEWGNGKPILDSVETDDSSVQYSCQNEERVDIIPLILFDTINSNTEEMFNAPGSIISDNGILNDEGNFITNPIVLDNSNNEEETFEDTTVLNEEESTIEQEEPTIINNNSNEEETQILTEIEEGEEV